MRTHQGPPSAEEVWAHLVRRWGPDRAAKERDHLEWRVSILCNLLRCTPAAVYAALGAGVRVYAAHRSRLRHQRDEKSVLTQQRHVLRDVERALTSVEAWCRLWGFARHEEDEMLCALRELRSEFRTSPLPLDEDARRARPVASHQQRLKQPRLGRPWVYRNYTANRLDRLGVPPAERQALLEALGFI